MNFIKQVFFLKGGFLIVIKAISIILKDKAKAFDELGFLMCLFLISVGLLQLCI